MKCMACNEIMKKNERCLGTITGLLVCIKCCNNFSSCIVCENSLEEKLNGRE